MMRACKVQCTACPFKPTSLPSYLGGYTASGVFQSLWKDEPFFCHMRANYERDDWLEVLMKDGELCLGALIARTTWTIPATKHPEVAAAVEVAKRYVAEGGRVEVMPPKTFFEWHDPEKRSENLNKGRADATA